MICNYCNQEMNDYTESFECCFNKKCPYLDLTFENKLSGFPRAFFKSKELETEE